jgi:hypothetical protein
MSAVASSQIHCEDFGMNVHLLTNASAFLDRTRDVRALEPCLTIDIGGTAASRGRRNTMVAFGLSVAETARVCVPQPVQDRYWLVACRSVLVTQPQQLRKGGNQCSQREFTRLTKRSACTIFAPRLFPGR